MILSWVMLFAIVGVASGCSCVMPPELSDDFDRTAIIFVGSVTAVTTASPNPFMGYADMTMKVEEAFKGVKAGDQVVVRTNLSGSMCGFGAIPVGARWQMWLTESKGAYLCSRSTPDAYKDIDQLRKLAGNYN